MLNAGRATAAHHAGITSLILLFVLLVAWELILAPIRSGGSWLVIKALPLLFPIWQLWRHPPTRRYTYQWSTLLIWFYFTEGVVRGWSDLLPASRLLALAELVLSVVFFVSAVIYVRSSRTAPNQSPAPEKIR